ncbi:MAG: sensor domain-containing phosphodiesterase, partial [Bacillota bacterium]
ADRRLLKGVVEIAGALGKATVAEFVEDEETLEFLRGLGVDYAQGFFIGRPEPAPVPGTAAPASLSD